jgi:predicted kinase
LGNIRENKLKQLLIISGASGSGKTTLSRTLAPGLDALILNAGDVVAATLSAHRIAYRSRPEAGRLFLEIFGFEALGPLLLDRLRYHERVIIDGLRLPEARACLAAHITNVFHIHLDASSALREERLLARDGRIERNNPADDFGRAMRGAADLVLTDYDLRWIDPRHGCRSVGPISVPFDRRPSTPTYLHRPPLPGFQIPFNTASA